MIANPSQTYRSAIALATAGDSQNDRRGDSASAAASAAAVKPSWSPSSPIVTFVTRELRHDLDLRANHAD